MHVFTLAFGRQEQHTNQTDSNLHCQWRSPFQRNGKEREHAETCTDSPNRNRRSSGFLRHWRAHELPGATCQWPLRWLFQSWICQWYGGPGVQGTTIIIASSRSVCLCFWFLLFEENLFYFLLTSKSQSGRWQLKHGSWIPSVRQNQRPWLRYVSYIYITLYYISVQLIRASPKCLPNTGDTDRVLPRPSDEIIGDIHLRSWLTLEDIHHQELLSGTANFWEFVRQKRANMIKHACLECVYNNNITQTWPTLANTHFG